MHGPSGSEKTALAAFIANNNEFPFAKLISPKDMIGFNEMSEDNYLNMVPENAHKSSLNLVIVDSIEWILEFVPIGLQFSDAVLQIFLVLLRKQPPNDRRLLILAMTTQRSVLARMSLLDSFDGAIAPTELESGLSLLGGPGIVTRTRCPLYFIEHEFSFLRSSFIFLVNTEPYLSKSCCFLMPVLYGVRVAS